MTLTFAPDDHPARFEILRVLIGSTSHGLGIEGTDDRDELGIAIPPESYVLGLQKFDSYVFRTQPEGVRSGPGDLDLVIYSLKKYLSLAVKGNPTVLTPLFSPDDQVLIDTWIGRDLREKKDMVLSRQAGHRFLGYLRGQRDRVLGRRGQARLPNRPELVEKYGYDTKYAGHMLRLAYQGIELMRTGTITLPMPEEQREEILGVRQGAMTLDEVLAKTDALEWVLERAIECSPLPERPDMGRVNRWLGWAHRVAWDSGFA